VTLAGFLDGEPGPPYRGSVPDSSDSPLGRLKLRRVAIPRTRGTWPIVELPWSRSLWGSFMPERRVRDEGPPEGRERRR
jgi:hypothetical protein